MQIDISPLIDIVFILVIFFIVTTVFNTKTGVTVDPPAKKETAKSLESDAIQLALTSQGDVFHGGKNYGFEGVEALIASLQSGKDPLSVVVESDRNANAEDLTKLIDAAHRAKAKSVSIVTKKK